MKEEEASPNRANAQGRAGERSRVRCVGSVTPYAFNSRRTRSRSATRTPAARERRRTSTARRSRSWPRRRSRSSNRAVRRFCWAKSGTQPCKRREATARPSGAVRKAGTTPSAVVGLCARPRLTRHSTYSKQNHQASGIQHEWNPYGTPPSGSVARASSSSAGDATTRCASPAASWTTTMTT